MPIELKVPEVGESIKEVTIGQWRKAVGDKADKDENLVEIESDKATVDLPAPISGTVTKVLKKQGEMANVGEVIGLMEVTSDAATAPTPTKPGPAGDAPATTTGATAAVPSRTSAETTVAIERKRGQTAIGSVQPAPAPQPVQSGGGVDSHAMPAAERLAAEKGVSLSEVTGSGPAGRILKEDVQRTIDKKSAPLAPTPSQGVVTKSEAPTKIALPPGAKVGAREEEFVVMSPIRRRIAERLVEAQQVAALLTTFNEIDMGEIMAMRARFKDSYQQRYGVKLGFMSFFVKAAIDALRQFPSVNAEVREPHVVYRNFFDIGIAVGGGKGLVVPILRNAEFMSFAEIEQTIGDFGRRAAENKIKLEELQGGTFTISNGGVYGSLLSTPIVNPPQSGILGLHAIQDRPVARNGQVVIRPMMYVALTYDHRVVDGREAVSFLKRIKDTIEDPARMLIEA